MKAKGMVQPWELSAQFIQGPRGGQQNLANMLLASSFLHNLPAKFLPTQIKNSPMSPCHTKRGIAIPSFTRPSSCAEIQKKGKK